ncbi:putative disease resistance RPP13-like protein 1 [Arachis duranensis]|uniref:Disease resistance RPP13-like protein 1 n=1 Tax=Arachis duranensis TaxID=130453 RepID=A0A6P5NPV8_ARADU|nr:putative disease resistance RPP13-like protein 1 [Arachis duranensis]
MADGASFRKQITSIFRHRMGSEKKNSEYDDLLEKIVGAIHREEEKTTIEILLKEPAGENGVPPVVAITGIAGIGKTTLALLVCEDDKVKGRFGSPIWLNAAGKTFDDLASIAGPVKAAATSSGNPSLLVLDDLRAEISKSKVSELRKHGVSVGAGAIIVTTRRTWQSHGDEAIHAFPLAGLDVGKNWSLFTSLGSSNKHKEEITEILDKCNGFPLAIKLVSTFLESRAGTLQEAKLSELLPRRLILQPHEVQLLAYVSLFPDDYLIHPDRLIHLWIAEGFVPPEEPWRRVIDDFVASGIFQDVKREEGGDGVVKSCTVHPYVQELARFVAKKDEFISTGIDESQLLLRASFDLRSADSVSKLELFLKEEKRARDLRTILFHGMVESPLVLGNQQAERMNEYTCDKVLSTCKALSIPSLGCLVKLSLYNCSTPEPLPRLDELPSLEVLELRRMHSLRFIAEKCDDSVHQVFTLLKELTLWGSPKLESWWNGKSKNSIIFSCISSLRIQYCPNLTRMPLYPTLDKMLVLLDSSVEPMRDTIRKSSSETGSKEEKVVPFSKLKCMFIASIKEFPQEKWLVEFTSLEKLHIRDCLQLEALPSGFKHLRSLQSLTIETCPVLDLDQSPDEWEGLEKLNFLIIREIPKLNSLPKGLKKVVFARNQAS